MALIVSTSLEVWFQWCGGAWDDNVTRSIQILPPDVGIEGRQLQPPSFLSFRFVSRASAKNKSQG